MRTLIAFMFGLVIIALMFASPPNAMANLSSNAQHNETNGTIAVCDNSALMVDFDVGQMSLTNNFSVNLQPATSDVRIAEQIIWQPVATMCGQSRESMASVMTPRNSYFLIDRSERALPQEVAYTNRAKPIVASVYTFVSTTG